MAVTQDTRSSVLMREEVAIQLPINYASNIFKDAAQRYSLVEKVGYTLLMAARRLRKYFFLTRSRS